MDLGDERVFVFCPNIQNWRKAHVSDVTDPAKTCFAPIRSCRRRSGRVANNLLFFVIFVGLEPSRSASEVHR